METQSNITLKEVYERVIVIEAKLDATSSGNVLTRRKFTQYVWWILFLLVVNLLATLVSIYLHGYVG